MRGSELTDPSTPPGGAPDRRQILRAGTAGGALLGVSSLVLPSSMAAASVAGVTQVPVSGDAIIVHLDAGLPGPNPTTSWQDLSGTGNPGTVGSAVTHVAASGATPAHYSFPGSTTSSTLTEVVNVRGGQPVADPAPSAFTRMLWFRRERLTHLDNLISSADLSTHADHFLFFNSTQPDQYRRLTTGHNASFTRIVNTANTSTGVWTFGAASFSTTAGFILFTNTDDRAWADPGRTSSSDYNEATDLLTKPMSFQIGGYAGFHRFQGDIATVIIHARALTEAEIKAYYAATVDRFHPPA